MSSSSSKKRRTEEIDLTGEDDLASVHIANGVHGSGSPSKPANSASEAEGSKARPDANSAITFLLIDICLWAPSKDSFPSVYLIGKAPDGQQIVRIRVKEFCNYFYADAAKFTEKELASLEGIVRVEACERRPLFYYRAPPDNVRRFWKVYYAFTEPKRHPKSDPAFYETEIKLRRRFQIEKALGAGCTTKCVNLTITSSSPLLLEAECHHSNVRRVDNEDIPLSVLQAVSVDVLRVHAPSRPVTGRCSIERGDPVACIALTSSTESTLFILNDGGDPSIPVHLEALCGRKVVIRLFESESSLIEGFCDELKASDPDVIVGWELIPRLEGLDPLVLSRMDSSLKLKTRLMTNYNASWVRRPNARMTSNSNQETFKVEQGSEGRILIDLLRTTTTKQKMKRYTLEESVQVFLRPYANPGERPLWMDAAMESFTQRTISETWRAGTNRIKVIETVLARSIASLNLEMHHALTAETLEGARLAMLSVWEVLYGAQMVRVHSLLLRRMYLLNIVSAGALAGERGDGVFSDPINAPFLIDPEEAKTQKLFTLDKDGPIAVLDFVSLYPSVIIAFNLCYTSYVHADEVERLFGKFEGPGSRVPPPRSTGSMSEVLTCAPAYPQTKAIERHTYVNENVAKGVLPELLKDLLAEREAVKRTMANLSTTNDALRRTVLNERQNQLKLCANAAYGFTGATQASPLAFTPIAETVLRFGQALCRKAVSVVQKEFPECKVIYGQTDSLFIALGSSEALTNYDAAKAKAEHIAAQVTERIGRAPIRLRLETLYDRLFLQGVNRYAGRVMDTQTLDIAGLESDSRKECALVRRAVKELLIQILSPHAPNYMPSVPRPPHLATAFAREWLEYNLPRAVPSELIITHALWRTDPVPGSSANQEEENQPHLAVARAQASKDPDLTFVLGERICFVFRAVPNGRKQADKARGPFDDVQIPFDMVLYLKNKLLQPIGRMIRVVAPTAWKQFETHWSGQTKVSDTVVPRNPRKCLGDANCRLLVQGHDALCARCRDERKILAAARVKWEAERIRLERKLHLVLRARQRSHLFNDASSFEFAALDHSHLVDELVRLDALLENRNWQ